MKHNIEINEHGEVLKSSQRKNVVEFFMFFWYSETLLKSLLFLTVFLCVDFLGFSTYKIIPSENWDHFISSFLICMPFISFSFIIALARTSSTILSKSDEGRHPSHVHDLRGKPFSLSPLRRMLIVGFFVGALYEVEDILLYSYFSEC